VPGGGVRLAGSGVSAFPSDENLRPVRQIKHDVCHVGGDSLESRLAAG